MGDCVHDPILGENPISLYFSPDRFFSESNFRIARGHRIRVIVGKFKMIWFARRGSVEPLPDG